MFLFQIEVVAQEKEVQKQKKQDKINTKTGRLKLTIDPGKDAEKDKIFNRKIEFRDELIVVNGKPTFRDPRDLYIDLITSIKQLNIEQAIAKYGTLGKKGAFEITTENNISPFSEEIKLMGSDKKTEKTNKNSNKSKNKKTVRITTKSKEPIKSYLKEYYIDGKKSTAFVYSKLDINNIDKIETNSFEKKVIITTKTSDTPKPTIISEQNDNSKTSTKINDEDKNSAPIDFIKTFRKALVIIDGKESNLKSLLKIKNRNIKIINANIFEESTDETKKITLATYGEKSRNGVLVVETSPL
ncbi:hypothetical protein FGL01_18880 [Flavobacterium glycines]|uniref:Uncharacterized protein n=1 Tax=Flavobacterium glycines TaxID=551990 RepID=A0A511CF18_9FLAO|nr:hypothetical protein FGL01_18880 [Flavobacterium glycines]